MMGKWASGARAPEPASITAGCELVSLALGEEVERLLSLGLWKDPWRANPLLRQAQGQLESGSCGASSLSRTSSCDNKEVEDRKTVA